MAAQSGDVPTNGYTVTMNQQNDNQGGGTSLSSPLWLGMWTRIQAASTRSKGNGFAAAMIYRLASDPAKYARDFFDIGGTSTDTAVSCNGPNPYNCSHPGWDYTSGWGVPDVTHLMLDADGKTAPTHVTTPNPAPPQPTFPGTHGGTCPGPQVVDPAGDALNYFPGGDGTNMANLDILNASFASPNATTLRVTLAVNNLSAPPPPINFASAYWTVYWSYNGTVYFAQAQSAGAGPAGVWTFSDGTYSAGQFNTVNSNVTGTATPGVYEGGSAGTLVMNVPLADVGNPAAGASLTSTWADTHASFIAVYYTAPADTAPNHGYGAPWTVGGVW